MTIRTSVLLLCAVLVFALSASALRPSSRRAFFNKVAATTVASVGVFGAGVSPGLAAPQIFTTKNGVKYAVLKKEGKDNTTPQEKDIVAIEYTGYLTDGSIFDSTHSEGKKNALMFEVGGNAVIDGINEMVVNMSVGQKVQAIVPPSLAFGDKGICIESGECLVKPKSTLVYDIYLKRAAIPPP